MKSKNCLKIKSKFNLPERYVFIWLLALLTLFSCNQGGKDGSSKAGGSGGASGNLKTATDSVFVINYLSNKKPAFKKHLELTKLFYQERDYTLAWFKNNKLVPQAGSFLDIIKNADQEALKPEDYQVVNLPALISRYEQTKEDSTKKMLQEEIDVALTATYFLYANDFYRGTVNPRKVEGIHWDVKRNKIKLHKALQALLKERDSRYPYNQFGALQEEYTELRGKLKEYRQIQQRGGWPAIEGVKSLKLNDSSEAVISLRERLAKTENPKPANLTSAVYDSSLQASVKSFQARHGLNPDGVIGPATLRLMNIPVEDRINQIIVNMERWRWLPKPKEMEKKLIYVNIPEFAMHVKEEGKEVMTMKVIVGKTMTSTPVFSDKLEYIVFSPYWNITKNILVNEVAPLQARKPEYMYNEEMEVVKDIGRNKVQIIPISSVDWANVTKDNFEFRVRQRPGKKNPLGYVKFIFPNEYEVYLHDTPGGHLFSREQRLFSHGCIRIEKPQKFAEYLLQDQPQWTPDAIKSAMYAGEEKYVNLTKTIPVYIVYFTAWVDDKGVIHFRDDIYKHDQKLSKAYFG
jgi:L,D-transpeptidase YcbB